MVNKSLSVAARLTFFSAQTPQSTCETSKTPTTTTLVAWSGRRLITHCIGNSMSAIPSNTVCKVPHSTRSATEPHERVINDRAWLSQWGAFVFASCKSTVYMFCTS